MSQDTGFCWPKIFPAAGRMTQAIEENAFMTGWKIYECGALQCGRNVSVNLFFDGTNNHLKSDEQNLSQTNVVRLYYACYEGLLDNHAAYKYYLQGVGTIFEEIKEDTFDRAGKSFASGFGKRVGWGYTRLLDAAWKATPKPENSGPLMNEEEAYTICLELDRTNGSTRKVINPRAAAIYNKPTLTNKLAKLASVYSQAGGPTANQRPRKIWVNVFGFSRGAAEARVFVNQLIKEWAPGGKLAGVIDYEVNFVGLFDTVASVGLVDSVRVMGDIPAFDGHWAWTANGALNIPAAVKRCVHFISIHEQRMSFPVDLIREGDNYPGNRLEVAYPGVHSDVGGGYRPGEQGKARKGGKKDVSHKLGQITLHDMYLEAVYAGVPLMSIDYRSEAFKEQDRELGNIRIYIPDKYANTFEISPDIITAFNDWVKEMPKAKRAEEAIRLGMAQRLAWMAKRADDNSYLTKQPFYIESQEDTLTPHGVQKMSDDELKALRRQRVELEQARDSLRQQMMFLPPEKRAVMKITLAVQDEKLRQINEKLFNESKRIEGIVKNPRPGEGAGDVTINDKTDLREGIEEFRLLLGYLNPDKCGPQWHCQSTVRWNASLWPIPIVNAIDSIQSTLAVKRETMRDGKPVYVTLTKSFITQSVGALFNDNTYYDVLLLPAKEVEAFLRDNTSADAIKALSKAACTLYDDYIHDSRAWFRVPYFHEQAPGGYGWPRVVFQGGDDRVEFLDIPELYKQKAADAKRAQQAYEVEQRYYQNQTGQMLQNMGNMRW